MKVAIDPEKGTPSIEFTPEEVGRIVPIYIRSLLNRKVQIIQSYASLKNKLIELYNAEDWKKFAIEKTYLIDDGTSLIVQKMPFFIKNGVKKKTIKEFRINCYKDSNIFFAMIDLFFKKLNKKDVVNIFDRFRDNDQAALIDFLEEVEKHKKIKLTSEMIEFIKSQND